MSFDLPHFLTHHHALVQAALTRHLDATKAPAILLEVMRYSLLAPGKRLRPMLVFLACQASGGDDDRALPAACAVEMIHTYSLIHDDLPAMDDDDLRRGLPTCHKKFGDALAILAGDALLTLAFQVLAEGYPPRTAVACCRELAQGAGAAGMVGGQVEDLACESAAGLRHDPLFPRSQEPQTLEALEHIHRLKTGALFQACLQLGLWAAQGERSDGPDPALSDQLDRFGRCLGLAFQITDDLLDVEGSAADTGKAVGKDAGRGKLTYPGLLGVAQSRRLAESLAAEACLAVASLGSGAAGLIALMHLVLQRNH